MEYRVKVSLSGLNKLADIVALNVLPGIQAAVEQTAQETQSVWQASVMKAPGVWLGHKQQYASSIQWKSSNPGSAEIWTDYPVAREVESGFPARDLKQMLTTSNKVRVTKGGKKYLVIPFRHNTPGNDAHAASMPDHIYAAAKGLAPSGVSGKSTRTSGTGATVPKFLYSWGDRLPAGLAPKLKPHHATDIYAGMTKFNTSSGGGKSSGYMTFRIMHEGQTDKWIVPAKAGLHIARDVADAMRKRFKDNLSKAIAS